MTAEVSEEIMALDEAARIAGGYGALAGKIGVAGSLPSMWKKRGSIPAEHCPAIERETGVACELLNKSVAWGVLRTSAATQGAA